MGSKPGYCGIVTYVKPGSLEPRAIYTDRELFAEEEDERGEVGVLGSEGRLVVTEHAVDTTTRLAVFNTYVPNAGGAGRPRLPFKLKFSDALYRHSKTIRHVTVARAFLGGRRLSPALDGWFFHP